MKKNDLLFVYGTLRKGESADASRHDVTFVCEDKVNGMMYQLGWFPGVNMLRDDFNPALPVVYGDVFRIDDDHVVEALDVYEGHPTFFNRRMTTTASGLSVWCYEYPHEMLNHVPIEAGDWTKRPIEEYKLKANQQIGDER